MKLKREKQIKIKCLNCYGISSLTQDNKHIFMADFDNITARDVIKELLKLQNDYDLSHVFVIKSRHGFNAICLDKLKLKQVYEICKSSDLIDKDFTYYNYVRRYYTLRFDRDKSLYSILHGFFNNTIQSNAHRKFLEFFFDIEYNPSYYIFDKFTKIDVIKYNSDKSGYHKETLYLDRVK